MTTQEGANTAAVIERLDALRGDIAEIKAQMSDLSTDYRLFRETSSIGAARVSDKVDGAHTRLDRLEPRVKALEDERLEVAKLTQRVSILIGVLSIIGTSAVLWLASQFLGLIR